MDEKEVKRLTQQYCDILERVKNVLNQADLSEDLSIAELCILSGVNVEEYYASLKVSQKGVVIILKRTVKDRFINNYNPRWIRAWQGNMDIQFCPDQFAVMTYVTDYY
jgi:hypothetical protein